MGVLEPMAGFESAFIYYSSSEHSDRPKIDTLEYSEEKPNSENHLQEWVVKSVRSAANIKVLHRINNLFDIMVQIFCEYSDCDRCKWRNTKVEDSACKRPAGTEIVLLLDLAPIDGGSSRLLAFLLSV